MKSSIEKVCADIKVLTQNSQWLNWLTDVDIVKLTEETCLIGHDSWADGRFGNYEESQVTLNDYLLIREFSSLNHKERLIQLNKLGDSAAAKVKRVLPQALERFCHALFLTHVPPFKEACFFGEGISDDNWLPHFGCKAVGEILVELMKSKIDRDMVVLCGHTHGAGSVKILPNLHVITGGAEYGKPQIQKILII